MAVYLKTIAVWDFGKDFLNLNGYSYYMRFNGFAVQ